MITFIIALLVLIGGYFLYGSYVEHLFSPDKNKKTPALTMEDGVDFIPLPTWKIFMIQFLNIAGLGLSSVPLWEQNSVRPLIYGLYWELFLPVLYTIIYQECFL